MRVRDGKDLGAVARQARRAAGRSQDDVAKAARVTRQWLSRFEKGSADVSLAKALVVLEVLGVAVNAGAAGAESQIARGPLFSAEAIRAMQDSIARGAAFVNSPEFTDSMQQSLEQITRLNAQNSDEVRRRIAALTTSGLVLPRLEAKPQLMADDDRP